LQGEGTRHQQEPRA